jgi:hypothetical protein
MDGYSVETETLIVASTAVKDVTDMVRGHALDEFALGEGITGHGGLAHALGEFSSSWTSGLSSLVLRSDSLADLLQASARSYVQADETAMDVFFGLQK